MGVTVTSDLLPFSVHIVKLGCCSNALMKPSISESLGAKMNSTKAGTHSRFVAENVLDVRDEDVNFNSFFSSYESPIKASLSEHP